MNRPRKLTTIAISNQAYRAMSKALPNLQVRKGIGARGGMWIVPVTLETQRKLYNLKDRLKLYSISEVILHLAGSRTVPERLMQEGSLV